MRNEQIAFYLAIKNIFSRPSLFLLVVGVVAVSFTNSLFMSGVFSGMIRSMEGGLIDSTYSNIVIEPEEDDPYFEDAASIMKNIESVRGVEAVTRRINLDAILEHDDRTVPPLFLVGIDPDREAELSNIPEKIRDGSYLEPSDSKEILLGADIANIHHQNLKPDEDTLGVEIGERVNVLHANGFKDEYRVKGIYFSKALIVDHMAMIPISDAEDILGKTDIATQILVKVPKGEEVSYIQEFRMIGIEGKIFTWKEKGSFVNFITNSYTVISAIVTSFSLMTVAIALFIVLYIQVTNRKKQIGILKAVGLDDRIIFLAYILQSVIYGIFGLIFGIMLFQLVYTYFESNPLETALGDVVPFQDSRTLAFNGLLIICISMVGGFIPSYYAAKENIIRSLWG
jgi:putative ABC transport system permease protein